MPETTLQQRPVRAGIFSTVEEARWAVDGLRRLGFTQEQISVACADEGKERHFREYEHQEVKGETQSAAAVAGGAIGAAAAGLGVVLSAVATGGVALWMAGPISAWAGGVVGGFVGAMMTRGYEKEVANFYQQALLEGDILVAVEDHSDQSEVKLARAAEVIASAGAKPLPLTEG